MIHKVSVVIVDDDIKSIEATRAILEDLFEEVACLQVFTDPISALKEIPGLSPDILFVDIEMPVMNGLDFVRALPSDLGAYPVFLTGYNQYAIPAYKVGAFDYLEKPLNPLSVKELLKRYYSKKSLPDATNSFTAKLVVNRVDKALLLDYSVVNYLMASGPYTHIFTTDGSSYVATKTLKHFYEVLPLSVFVRPHRSFMFNIMNLKEIKKESDGSGVVFFESGHAVEVTLDCKNSLIRMISSV